MRKSEQGMPRSVGPRVKLSGRALTSLRVAVTAALLLALVVIAEPAQSAATTFTVNSTGDAVDANPGDGTCQTSTAGECTLRAAIQEANDTTDADTINFTIPGTGCSATSEVCTIEVGSSSTAFELSLPNIIQPVTIDGFSQTGASPATATSDAVLKIELDGTKVGDGLTIQSANSTVRGLIFNRFANRTVWIPSGATGNKVTGNFIGTNAAGTTDLGNLYGVFIEGANNTVGGTEAGARNVISGNGIGVFINLSGATGNKVTGNYIGTKANGTEALGNDIGVNITGGPSNNSIGGTEAGARNVISGNGGDGVYIHFSGTSGNKVTGNFIGTDATGAADLGNGGSGVRIENQASTNTVGGTEAGARNVISGNGGDGVAIGDILGAFATGNQVIGNYIGTDVSGTQLLGNTGNGVEIRGSSSTGNSILSNSIYTNGELGIDLVGGDETSSGVTKNDIKDPDTGANRRQNFPLLSSATLSGDQIKLSGQLNSRPKKTFTIQFFSSPAADPSGFGEGKSFLGQIRVITNREGKRSFRTTISPIQPVSPGEKITATATRRVPDPSDPTTLLFTDTSEFSAVKEVS